VLKMLVRSLIRNEQGQDLIEHAMIAGLISILIVVAGKVVRGE